MMYRNGNRLGVTAATLLLGLTAVSPVRAQLPGSPQQRVNIAQSNIYAQEALEPDETVVVTQLPVAVNSGFLVMTEDGSSNAASNWSDVVYFHNITVGVDVIGEARFISDSTEFGIVDGDLTGLGIPGLTTAQIIANANTQYFAEANNPFGFGVQYSAPNLTLPPGDPGTTRFLNYTFISETPEPSSFAFAGIASLSLLGFARRRMRRNR